MNKTAIKRVISFLIIIMTIASSALVIGAENDKPARTVRISCGINDLLYLDDDNKPSGYCSEYLNKLADINNWKYEYIEAQWNDAVKMLKNGELDILFPTSYNAEHALTMDYSTIVGGYVVPGLFARVDSDYDYEGYEGFNGAKIAVTETSSNNKALIEFAKESGFSYDPVYINSVDEKIKALQNGSVDMVIFNAANYVPNAKLVAVLNAEPFYYTVKKGNDKLLSELNRGMERLLMRDPDIAAETISKSMTGNNGSKLAFTLAERSFIESQKEITIGFYENTEPLAFVDAEGKYDGIYVNILNRIKKASGINIKLYPINRDIYWQDLINDGTIDFYIGSSDKIASLDSSLITTNSFMDYETVLITKNDFVMDNSGNIKADEKIKLALTQARSYWKNNNYIDLDNIEVEYYRTAKDCLIAVKNGKADMTILNTIEYNYQSKNSRFTDLVQWENYKFKTGAAITSARDIDDIKYSVINKAVNSLNETEISDIIDVYLNMSYNTTDFSDYLYSYRYFLIILSFVVIILAVAAFAKKKQNDILRITQEREERQLRIMAALSVDYVSVYYVNLDDDSYTIEKTTDKLRADIADIVKQSHIYSKTMEHYINTYITEEYRENLFKTVSIPNIIKRFKEDKFFSVRYKVMPNEYNKEYFEMHFVDVSDDKGENIMIMGFRCVDEIAKEEIETQEALKAAYESANRANRAKSDFLSKMSHDMRTPMNAIIGMTAIAAAHIDDKDRVLNSLGKITSSGRHLLGLINEVLDMSKIESGKISLSEEEFNLSELIENVLVIMQSEIKSRGHKLDVHILNVKHEDVIGDALRIQQAIINILGNAIKYTPDNGRITVSVSEKPTNQRLYSCYEFVVEDNGIGMSKEYIEHLFEPFSRAEDVRISKIHGTGLGMTITQNIVHMMNGSIQVDSEPGKGSKFTVTIYLKLQDKQDTSTDEFVGLPVLVADDDIIACEAACDMLNEIGMDSEWVLSGAEAVEKVKVRHNESNDYYAVILDWKMPEMDGLETARAIRKIVGRDVPIIILSAYDWSDIEAEAREAGVDAFLGKPVFKSGLTRLFKNLRKGSDNIKSESLDTLTDNDYTGITALLAEDNDLNREIAAEILTMSGMKVEEAKDGKEALDMFAASAVGYYDIIFMDIQMPVMNGYKSVEAIRGLERVDAANVPIIAMTANAFTDDVISSKKAGMNEHLAKPIDFNKLRQVLNKYLK